MYLGVAVVIVLVTPFPFSIYASLLVLFLLNMIRSRVVLRRSNETMLRVLQKWLTSVGNNSKVATSIGVWHTPMRFTVCTVAMNTIKLHVVSVVQRP